MAAQPTRRFWKALPPRPFAAFLAAVFFTFSAFGFLFDVMSGGRLPPAELAFQVALCGTVAIGFAWSMTKWRALLPVVLLVQVAGIGLARPIDIGAGRLTLDAAGAIVCLVAGYVFFVAFIGGEGAKAVRLQAEMGLAQEIHATLAPPLSLRNDVCEVVGRSMPTSEVGGDLLDVVVAGDCTTSYVVDVSGHGVPAGSLMGMIKSAARMRLLSSPTLGALLTDLNRIVFEVKRPNMFATAACVSVSQGRAAYALAGHLPILHYRAKEGTVERLGEGQTALGFIEGQVFEQTDVAVGSGDILALLTDGLTEVEGRAKQELGLEPIEHTIVAHAELPLEKLLDQLFERARQHGVAADDQTALLVRVR